MVTGAADHTRSSEDRTLRDLTPNVAGLLCYVAGWVSGIVFLVLEQKNRFIRFHAIQSIIVFGILTLASAVLGRVPVMGGFFNAALGVTGFVLWIILMVKAVNGEVFKMPWAGDLAERLTNDSMNTPRQAAPQEQAYPREQAAAQSQAAPQEAIPVIPIEPVAPASTRTSYTSREERIERFRSRYYSSGARAGRIVGSAFAIAWSAALLIFFNFYNQYIAYYEQINAGGTTQWQMHTLVNSDFSLWLPILTATLVLSIIAHAIMIVYDKYLLREAAHLVLDVLGAVTVVTLLSIYPFDFSSIPNGDVVTGLSVGITVTLVLFAIGFSIGALVRFIKLVVNLGEGKY